VSHINVIFDLNQVLVVTKFQAYYKMGHVSWYKKPFVPNWTIVLKPRLKEFLERCMLQFIVYIWFVT
jgi:hypothetical protein